MTHAPAAAVNDVLARAYELIKRPYGWTKGSFTTARRHGPRTAADDATDFHPASNPDPWAFCAVGAIGVATHQVITSDTYGAPGERSAVQHAALQRLIECLPQNFQPMRSGRPHNLTVITRWNDAENRRKREVEEAFRCAVEKGKK